MIGNCLQKTPNYFTKSDVSKPFNATPPKKKGGQKRKKKREKREWEEKGGREGDLKKKHQKTEKQLWKEEITSSEQLTQHSFVLVTESCLTLCDPMDCIAH